MSKYFIKFVNKVPSFGKSFICIDDKNNKNLIKRLSNKNFYTYGTDTKSNFCIRNIKQSKDYSEFDLKIIAATVVPTLVDPKRRVRHASLG